MDAPPKLPALYAAALARSAGSALRRGARADRLPTERHRLDNLTANQEKLDAFQRLMGRPRAEFLPSGYLHTLAFPVAVSVLARPDFPLPLLGMIHLRNEIHHLRPIALNECLSVTAWVENLLQHRSGMQVDVMVDIRSSSEPVWKGRSTYLAKGVKANGPKGTAAPSGGDRSTEQLPGFPTREWVLARNIGRRYAAVSGDYNPIHLSGPLARVAGMKQPIAHGMYLASRMAAEMGPGDATPFRWSVEFRAPVSLPSAVFLSAGINSSVAAQWRGAEVVAWDPRRRRTHFSGSLERLGSSAGAE
ncbi:MaoC family dehydratase [Arthrobacter tumbae]|uniref:MaoC family dehydratase n=1 Tax=Arthrobacter tumbae TaxID=163874 RepID=UPI00195E60C4|nr:MaoC/PaaZ C-terminal domain-containing protein [Arthrobacter tumbae]MBM7783107.1 acyl dehydratase [Arthrobacter tumbae]